MFEDSFFSANISPAKWSNWWANFYPIAKILVQNIVSRGGGGGGGGGGGEGQEHNFTYKIVDELLS